MKIRSKCADGFQRTVYFEVAPEEREFNLKYAAPELPPGMLSLCGACGLSAGEPVVFWSRAKPKIVCILCGCHATADTASEVVVVWNALAVRAKQASE